MVGVSASCRALAAIVVRDEAALPVAVAPGARHSRCGQRRCIYRAGPISSRRRTFCARL